MIDKCSVSATAAQSILRLYQCQNAFLFVCGIVRIRMAALSLHFVRISGPGPVVPLKFTCISKIRGSGLSDYSILIN